MLQTLRIRNFAIIDDLTLDFSPGFNVISGETGVGKSIIIQALALILGARGYSDLIRKGEKEASVEALFFDGKKKILLGRTLSEEGKNKIVIDGKSAPLSTLQKVSQGLIDLATQHENQSLLQPEKHREILDAFGGFEKAEYQNFYQNCFELTEKKKKFLHKVEETRKEEDFLQFQLQEIREAKLEEGEEERLLQEREVAKHAVRLGQALERIESSLLADGEGSIDRLSSFIKELQGIALIDP
ncbi:MAG: AAA family ATPase, partial [Deltaproteobacteria bacterium]|nr:AAA family ATPase [Deltaproteobacteria bacterium]